MKFALIFISAMVATLGCSRKPKDLKGQVSYSVGAQFGRSLKSQGLELDTKALGNGIVDGYKGEKLELTDEEMQQAMMKMSENRQAEQRAEAEKNKAKADAFLAKNAEDSSVKKTESGLQYKVLQEGTGATPKETDIVVVNYSGKLIDGTEFDSNSSRGGPAEFPVRGVVPGFSEGLRTMKKGGKSVFFVPPNLGYGERSRQKMPSNSVLIFEVELVDFRAGPPMSKGYPGRPGMGRPKGR